VRPGSALLKQLLKQALKQLIQMLPCRGWRLLAKSSWRKGARAEIAFWDHWFATKGAEWPEEYRERLDPQAPLQEALVTRIPAGRKCCSILDVGAGPLTWINKQNERARLSITAVDALAAEYDRLLQKYDILPIIRTRAGCAERLTELFPQSSFDIVFSRNALDHTDDPLQGLKEMLRMLVPDGKIVLMVHENEGARVGYGGLHKWDFFVAAPARLGIKSHTGVTKYVPDCLEGAGVLTALEQKDGTITAVLERLR
jgi:SAM-dependent methyltransferase